MAPPQGQMRPGRQLAVLGLIFVVLYLLVFFAGGARAASTDRLQPKLGLDLIGGTRVTLEATRPVDGKPADGGEPGGGPADHRRAGSTASASPRPRWSSRATATSSSPCPARTATSSDVGERRRAAVPQGAQGSRRQRRGRGAPPGATPPPRRRPAARPGPVRRATPSRRAAPRRRRPRRPPAVRAAWPRRAQRQRRPPRAARPRPSAAAPRRAPAPSRCRQSVEEQRKAVEQKVGARRLAGRQRAAGPGRPDRRPVAGREAQAVRQADPGRGRACCRRRCSSTCRRSAAPSSTSARPASICDADAAGRGLRGRRREVPARHGEGAGHRRRPTPARCSTRPTPVGGQPRLHRRRPGQVDRPDPRGVQQRGPGLRRRPRSGQDGKCRVAVVLDNKVVSAPEIQGVLTGDSQITGSFTSRTPTTLASQLQLRRAAGDLRAAGRAERHRDAGRQPPAGRPARRGHRHAAGRRSTRSSTTACSARSSS